MIKNDETTLNVPHDALRILIGVLGLSLPLLLILGAWVLQTSISDYYYTNMRDFFEGVLFFLAFFLFAYRPYGRDGWQDSLITDVAGASALLLALFPTNNETLGHLAQPLVLKFVSREWSGQLHNLGSAGLFVSFALMSLFYFTKGKKEGRGRMKFWRNGVYVLCGLGIAGCIGYIGYGALTAGSQSARDLLDILVPEASALVLFGFSWLVKGGAIGILNDRKS